MLQNGTRTGGGVTDTQGISQDTKGELVMCILHEVCKMDCAILVSDFAVLGVKRWLNW